MIFEGPETKSGRPFEASVPEWIVPFLERYLSEIRPIFLGANHHDGLWASTKGHPLTDKAISRVITDRTRDAFGQPVNPHLFRACAATTIALLDPGRIGIARELLAHVSLVTTEAHYNKASSIAASRLYANVLAELRVSSANRHAPRSGPKRRTRCLRDGSRGRGGEKGPLRESGYSLERHEPTAERPN